MSRRAKLTPQEAGLPEVRNRRVAGMRPRRRPGKRWTPLPSLQWVLDNFTAPAIVRNGRMDLLAVNHLGRAMHSSLYAAEPGSSTEYALALLASWAATKDADSAA